MTASAVLWPKIRCIINLIFSFLPWSLGVEEYVEDDSKWEKKKARRNTKSRTNSQTNVGRVRQP